MGVTSLTMRVLEKTMALSFIGEAALGMIRNDYYLEQIGISYSWYCRDDQVPRTPLHQQSHPSMKVEKFVPTSQQPALQKALGSTGPSVAKALMPTTSLLVPSRGHAWLSPMDPSPLLTPLPTT